MANKEFEKGIQNVSFNDFTIVQIDAPSQNDVNIAPTDVGDNESKGDYPEYYQITNKKDLFKHFENFVQKDSISIGSLKYFLYS